MTKNCSKCKTEKPLTEFWFAKSGRHAGKPYYYCKECMRSACLKPNREHQARLRANPVTAEKLRLATRKWTKENAEKVNETHRRYRKQNPERVIGWRRKSNVKCQERIREYRRQLKVKNPNYFLAAVMRTALANKLRIQGAKKTSHTLDLLGCSIDELKSWLSGWFQPGMSWDNYGDWHIDHRRPCASFDLSNPEQQKRCFHYLNLQPLWAKDNLSKGAKFGTI